MIMKINNNEIIMKIMKWNNNIMIIIMKWK